MKDLKNIKVLYIAGFGPIVQDQKWSRKLYLETLGIKFEEMEGGYMYAEGVEGAKHFSIWPLSQAAQACFGNNEWPKDFPIPQAWLEFEVEDIEASSKELEKQGYKLFVKSRKEPWGQTVTRFLSPEGLLLGLSHFPPDAWQK